MVVSGHGMSQCCGERKSKGGDKLRTIILLKQSKGGYSANKPKKYTTIILLK
jgi:hypothetical protein